MILSYGQRNGHASELKVQGESHGDVLSIESHGEQMGPRDESTEHHDGELAPCPKQAGSVSSKSHALHAHALARGSLVGAAQIVRDC